MSFMGYKRPDGSIGVRNHVAIMSSVMCANEVVLRIVEEVSGTVPLIHNQGCGEYAYMPYNTLAGLGKNPNVAALLLVGLGCEIINPKSLAKDIAKSGKPVESVVIQEVGGSRRAIDEGVRIAERMVEQVSENKRTPADLSNLMLALECGGSDTTSGIAANPALGKAVDMIVKAGGTAILAETQELIGAQLVLARRAVDEKAAQQILRVIGKMEERMTKAFPIPVPLITPGNVQGGLTTVEEKSLGDSYKAGTSPIQGMLEYAQTPKKKGLWIMDEVGYDPESVTGMIAAGAQLVAFTTGLRTPSTFPIAPVIMITGNPGTYEKLRDDIDIDAGTIIESKEAIDDVGKRIYDEILAVASGKATKTDALGHRGSFAIYWPWPIPKPTLGK